jgi:hypothetical protein
MVDVSFSGRREVKANKSKETAPRGGENEGISVALIRERETRDTSTHPHPHTSKRAVLKKAN